MILYDFVGRFSQTKDTSHVLLGVPGTYVGLVCVWKMRDLHI